MSIKLLKKTTVNILVYLFFFYIFPKPFLVPVYALQPANPNANEDTRKVLNWIENLPNRNENRVISGQHLSSGWYASGYTPPLQVIADYQKYVVSLNQTTGKWPALIGSNYNEGMVYDSYSKMDREEKIATVNKILINWWKSGGLVTVDHLPDNPWTGGDYSDVSYRGNFEDLITPGKAVSDKWIAELDTVAVGLKELGDAGVVVIFRTLPEMTYNAAFWWDAGAYGGDWTQNGQWSTNTEPYKNLWKHMFNYFTYTKGLNNLLWVYCAADTDSWNYVDSMYPGDGYVDITGIDVYSNTTTMQPGSQPKRGYERLLTIGKPFILPEVGPGTMDGSFDDMTVINSIRNNYPKTVYFQFWHSWPNHKAAMIENQNASALLSDPLVITRDEVDWRGSLPSCPLNSQGDLDCNNSIGIEDLLLLLNNWGSTSFTNGDCNHNGTVEIGDLLVVLSSWGS